MDSKVNKKIKFNNVNKGDVITVYGKDWVSNVMGRNNCDNCLLMCSVFDEKNFEINLGPENHNLIHIKINYRNGGGSFRFYSF